MYECVCVYVCVCMYIAQSVPCHLYVCFRVDCTGQSTLYRITNWCTPLWRRLWFCTVFLSYPQFIVQHWYLESFVLLAITCLLSLFRSCFGSHVGETRCMLSEITKRWSHNELSDPCFFLTQFCHVCNFLLMCNFALFYSLGMVSISHIFMSIKKSRNL